MESCKRNAKKQAAWLVALVMLAIVMTTMADPSDTALPVIVLIILAALSAGNLVENLLLHREILQKEIIKKLGY